MLFGERSYFEKGFRENLDLYYVDFALDPSEINITMLEKPEQVKIFEGLRYCAF